ncbi:MAG: hypothetical protein GY739_17445 [Mesoflavibacter sp.]|nr:hypothetical protein [Mesoflavibacter sp.]
MEANFSTHINNIHSKYTDLTNLNTLCNNNSLIAHINVRSLDKNGDKLILTLQELNYNLNFIAITEVWGNYNNFDLQGFNLNTSLRKDKRGGGVAILAKNNIKTKIIKECTFSNENIEILTLQYKMDGKIKLIASVYRPPQNSLNNINNFLEDIKKIIDFKNKNFPNSQIDFLGDYNINILNHATNNLTHTFLQGLADLNLSNNFNIPTRITHNSKTCIDNIFSDYNISTENYVLPTSISDHFMILKIISQNKDTPKPEHSYKRIFNHVNTENFISDIKDSDWSELNNSNCSTDQWNIFFNIIDKAFNDNFPLKKIKHNNKNQDKPWINNEIKTLNKKERKLYLIKTKTNNPVTIQKHKDIKKLLDTIIRREKINYFKQQFKNTYNKPKQMWKIINKITNKSPPSNNDIDCIKINNTLITDKKEIAENMNTFFSNIGNKLANNITTNDSDQEQYINNIPESQATFKFSMVTAESIKKIAKNLQPKMSAGPDNIPSKITKIILNTIPNTLARIINTSLKEGNFHDRLKEASIISIYKKGDKTLPDNYRPIHLINSISKAVEKIVAFQLRQYLEQNNIINKNQYGFRKKHSTIHAMLSMLSSLENHKKDNKKTASIFIDLTKAFDTVQIPILLKKLEKIGIKGTELKWFNNYLKNRKSRCKIGNQSSNYSLSSIGVPQGSILGPILFIIYINDLPEIVNEFINLFADDTMIAPSSHSEITLETKSNNIMSEVANWFKLNKLTLNPSKTRAILFNTNKNINLKINNTNILEINSKNTVHNDKTFKFLGFNIDEKLDFKAHIKIITNKLNSANHILRKIKKIVPLQQKILIYNAIFKPHLEYGCALWANNKNTVDSITKLQKQAVRSINGSTSKKHTDPLFKKLKILKFSDLVEINKLAIAHAIFHNYSPKSLYEHIQKESEHERLRRNLLNLKIDASNKKSITKYLIPLAWNNINPELKTIQKKSKFTSLIKTSLLQNYSNIEICNDNNCKTCK